MGEFWVKGPHALEFLQDVTSNNAAALVPGKVQYSCLPNEEGGIVDDLVVYDYGGDKYMMVVNAANIDKDWNWCVAHNRAGAVLENSSDRIGQLAVQGPKALPTLQKLTSLDLSEIAYYTFRVGELAGVPEVIISNTGYTGAGGFELYFRPEDAIKIWNAVFDAGAEFGIKPIGLGARDTLRLEAAMPLYGHEMDETVSPLEAGLDFGVKLGKEEFIGRDALTAAGAPARVRVGLEVTGRGIAREHQPVFMGDVQIGMTTSGTHCPAVGKALAMALVDAAHSAPGTEVEVDIRGRRVSAQIVPLPFYKR